MTSTVRIGDRSIDREADAVLAFEDRYLQHRAMVIRFAASRGASDPESVADKALLDTYQAIPRLRSGADAVVEAYLIRAATSHIASEASTEIRERTAADRQAGTGPGFENHVIDRMELHRILGDLTDAQRAVIELRFLEDLTSAEIGRRLGKSEGTVRQLQHRALLRLRRLLFSGALLIGAVVLTAILLAGTGPDNEPADGPAPSPAPAPVDGIDPPGGATPTPTSTSPSPGPLATVDLGPRPATPQPTPAAPPAEGRSATSSPQAGNEPAAATPPTVPAAYEGFDLGLGDGDPFEVGAGVSSFGFDGGAWSIRLGEGDLRFDAAGLDYLDAAGNRLATTDGALRATSATSPLSLTRPLPADAFGDGEYWVAFLVRVESGGIGDAFWSPDALWDRGGFGIQGSPQLRFVNGPRSSVDVEVGVTHLLVGRIRPDEAVLWIDPDLGDPGSPDLTEARAPSEPAGVAAFAFNAIGDGTYTIDEFRIGASFAAVTPTR